MPLTEKHRIAGGILLGLLATPGAHAVSIGEASLHSHLMQPLNADIRLHGVDGPAAADLKVEIGDPADFARLGIDPDGVPNRLKLRVEKKQGYWVVRATTPNAIHNPYLQFPLELRSGRLRLVKEITLLLDPPPRPTRQPAITSTPPRETTRTPVGSGAPATPATKTYRVKRGDTLWPIAESLRPGGITNYQMMIALQRANPAAFKNGDINLIRSGSLLRIPSAEEIRRIDRREAKNEFWRQQQSWKSARAEKVAEPAPEPVSGQPPMPPTTPGDAVQRSPLRVGGAPAEGADEPRLEVLPPPEEPVEAPEAADREAVQREILLNEEKVRSQELEQARIRQQIANLQAQMDQMQSLLELKDQQIAALQSIIETRELARQLDSGAASAETALAPQPATAPTGDTQPASPQPTAPVTLATDQALHPDDARTEQDRFIPPWHWLWILLGGLVVLLLALMLKRRGGNETTQGDLPLGAHPEIAGAGRRPDANQVETPAAEPPRPGTPDRSEAPEPSGMQESRQPLEIPATTEPPAPQEAPAPRPQGSPDTPADAAKDEDLKPDLPQEDEIDIDLSELEDEINLPELDEEIKPLRTEDEIGRGEGGGKHTDNIAAFWDELDTSGLDEAEIPPLQDEDEDQSTEIVLEMARAYVELGDRDEAVAILQQALAGAEDDEKRERIQKALDEI